MYELICNKEVIDTAETLKDAEYLQVEYQMAYGRTVKISRLYK